MNLDWWLHSRTGQVARVAIGVAVLAAFAFVDWRRNGQRATRWREYCFLLACVAIALLYGVVNDQITSTISWEYFAFGKGIAEKLPANEPPNSPRFRWEAAKIGMQATWSAGLLIGIALLIANNPRKTLPRLPLTQLLKHVPLVLGVAVVTSAALAVAGYFGAFTAFSDDFRQMLARDEMRPRRFMAVFGEHLGGYLGGVLGTVIAVVRVVRTRKRLRESRDQQAFPL
jgi:hypothetical protein